MSKKRSTKEIVERDAKKKKRQADIEKTKDVVMDKASTVTGHKKKKGKKLVDENVAEDKTLFGANRKDFKELICSEGLDLNPNEYIVVHDGVVSDYTMTMYINRLPKATKFATTYARLFNFPNVISNVFIKKLDEVDARTMADKRVRALGAERADCTDPKTGRVRDENKYRRLNEKYMEAQDWARRIESGDNALYAVQFMFTIKGTSLDELKHNVNSFYTLAASSDIELVSCFCVQDKAFLSAYPLNKIQKIGGKTDIVKTHYLDKFAVGDIFNHTNSHFFHEDGVFMGHYIDNHQVMTWDPFDKSHEGYGVMFLGSTGVGKSATIKMAQKRMIDFGMRVRTLDVDSPSRRGEYSILGKACGGIHFEIKTDSPNILNPYDINVESVYDQDTEMEYDTLALDEKLSYLENLILSMVEMGKGTIDKVTESALRSIVTVVNFELYEERGIIDKQPDSLYTDEVVGRIGSGRRKKLMPTLSDAYKKILLYRAHNQNEYYGPAYQILIDTMQFYVKEIYYSDKSCTFFTREEYEAMGKDELGRKCTTTAAGKEVVTAVRGIRSYFDGQSTMSPSYSTPYIDYDISQLPRNDKPFAMIVCLGYMEENDVRTNSSNPLRAEKMVVLMDELHMAFPYEKAREIIVSFYRQARKRWISPWCATQSIADFDLYPDMLAIFKNSDSQFIFRHSDRDRDYIAKHLPLTDTQVEQVLNLGLDPSNVEATVEERNARRGEVCLIDTKRVAFIKMDYLIDTEARFVETNVAKIKELTQMAMQQGQA